MAPPTPARSARGRVSSLALVALAGLLFFAPAAALGTNTIMSITTVGQTVEITVNSTIPFDVRDELVVLMIGDLEFTTSRSPEDGNLNELIFVLTLDEWNQVATGDPVSVQYGPDDTTDRWNFGTLDKSLLNQ
ncbi:MAG TPA: hypothetical protein VKJ47_24280 [Candidatus Binatia bacterium]|nr:hypothetical protein [Candidatus Binatia bacterium]